MSGICRDRFPVVTSAEQNLEREHPLAPATEEARTGVNNPSDTATTVTKDLKATDGTAMANLATVSERADT